MLKPRMSRLFTLLSAALLVAFYGTAAAAGEIEEAIAAKLSAAVPQLDITGVTESEVPGLYEVTSSNSATVLVTEDGQYLLAGDLFRISPEGIANLSEDKRLIERSETLQGFGMDGVISYPAKGEEKASIAVFTDIDCPYCRKFHDEMPQLNELGITVHYFGFPRSGPGTSSFNKYVSVWCADDQRSAMDAAKQGKNIDRRSCDNPVLAQYQLGQQVGVSGTPAIIMENGQVIPGYRPAEQLAQDLGLF